MSERERRRDAQRTKGREGIATASRGVVATFFAELTLGLTALPGLALGFLVIAAFFAATLESSETWWQAILGFGLVVVLSVVALAGISFVVARAFRPPMSGWLGMLSGGRPAEFAAEQHNGARAVADLLVFATLAPLGVVLYRHGVDVGQANWTVQGLFLAAGAALVGLGAAVPRFYFAARAESAADSSEAAGSVRFVVAAVLGLGLSFGISMGLGGLRPQRELMRANLWHWRCVTDAAFTDCQEGATLKLVPPRAGLYAIDTKADCGFALRFLTPSGGPAPLLGESEQQRLGIALYDKGNETRTRVLRLAADEPVQLDYTYPVGHGHCTFKVRYRLVEGGAR
ncbi:MAG: hypothetical protein OZ921_00575 [Sorangiineae bacterium]|nr:hypothetical protein [Polyangiaceae bacterium]MEB2320977.1 hypothetical protein [Sorangiineae bacterium]